MVNKITTWLEKIDGKWHACGRLTSMDEPKAKTCGPKARCLQCGDIIQSKHVHDFVFCKCKAIALDGGAEYTKCSGQPSNFEWIEEEERKHA